MATTYFQIISKEIIKPSSPTPPHLKTYNLSLLDQLTTPSYTPFVFFYDAPNETFNISSHLKKSLSDTLARYYPFAGRLINKGTIIDCNDEGVELFEGKIHCQMHKILKKPEDESINYLFPSRFLWLNESENTSLLAVQFTSFECGGIAVSLCISHKIADGFSIATFVNDWAKVSRGVSICPEFIAMTMQPLEDDISLQEFELEKSKTVTKRFVFDPSRLAHLKARAVNSGLTNPTRVELVTALLYETAMSAARSRSGLSKNTSLVQLVNMRPKMSELPFSRNSLGNFTWYFTVFAEKESEKNLSELTSHLREGILQLCCKNGEKVRFDEWILEVSKSAKEVTVLFSDMDIYRCSSFCRFSFYEVDFGWGKPLWVRMASSVYKNVLILMDSRDGHGIEALVTLQEDDMAIFEHDKELLSFASLNPSVL